MSASKCFPALLISIVVSPLSVAVPVSDGIGYSGGIPGIQHAVVAASVDADQLSMTSSLLNLDDVVAGRPPRPTPTPMPRPAPRPPWELS